MASSSTSNSKLLPSSPYVVSASFYTKLFNYDHSQTYPASHTWEQEVLRLASGNESHILALLRKASQGVDTLETLLQAKGDLWISCGFGPAPPKPISQLRAQDLADFMMTHLLDRLTWAFCSKDFTYRPLQLYIHAELQNKPWVPVGRAMVSKYISFNAARFHSTLDHFVNLSNDSEAIQPSYHPPQYIPLATISDPEEVPTTAESSLGHPSSWTDNHILLGHVKTTAVAFDHIRAKENHQIKANIWILAFSMLFTLHSHEKDYASRLQESLRYMDLDDQGQEFLKSAIMEPKGGRSHPTLGRLFPAAIALWHSPIFILDPSIDLTAFDFRTKDFTLQKLVNLAFLDPPCTSERAVAAEKCIWRVVGQIMGSAQHAQQNLTMKTSRDFHLNLSIDISVFTPSLSKEFRQCSRVQWPHNQTRPVTDSHSLEKSVTPNSNPLPRSLQGLEPHSNSPRALSIVTQQPPDPKGKGKAPAELTESRGIRGHLGWHDPPSTVPPQARPAFLPYPPRIWHLPQAVDRPAHKPLPPLAILPAQLTVTSPSPLPEEGVVTFGGAIGGPMHHSLPNDLTPNDDPMLPPVHRPIDPTNSPTMDHGLHHQFTTNDDIILPTVPGLDDGENQEGESEQDPESDSHDEEGNLPVRKQPTNPRKRVRFRVDSEDESSSQSEKEDSGETEDKDEAESQSETEDSGDGEDKEGNDSQSLSSRRREVKQPTKRTRSIPKPPFKKRKMNPPRSATKPEKIRPPNVSSPTHKRAKWDQFLSEETLEIEGSYYKWVPHVDSGGRGIRWELWEDWDRIPAESQVLETHRSGFLGFGPASEAARSEFQPDRLNIISVIRHVLLPDGNFYKQSAQFGLSWPEGCESDKKYLYHLLKNSRPAAVSDMYPTISEHDALQETPGPGLIYPQNFTAPLEQNRQVDADLGHKCERIIAEHPCLVIPPRSQEDNNLAYEQPILKWEDIAQNLRINVHVMREIHDCRKFDAENIEQHMLAGSIQDIIAGNRRAVNVLDMPNPACQAPRWIQSLSLDVLAAPFTGALGYSTSSMRWNLCATQPALTRLHYDPGKFATWLRILRGTKIWFILDGPIPPEGLAGFDVSQAKFVYFVLEEGSTFTMPPGIPHAVLNVTDCVAEGGHMFLRPALRKSLEIGLREHHLGHQDTNASHIGSEVVLHAIWLYYYLGIIALHPAVKGCLEKVTGRIKAIPFSAIKSAILDLPELEELAALLCMCAHPLVLEPAPVEGQEPVKCSITIYDQRQECRLRIEEVLIFVTDLWKPVAQCETHMLNVLGKEKAASLLPLMDEKGKPNRRRVGY